MIHWKIIGRIAAVSFLSLAAVAVLVGIFRRNRSGWTEWERKVITRSDSLLYVTVLPEDSLILRTPSKDVTPQMLRSALLKRLTAKMLHTVRHPSQDGVGIAAPQVGVDIRAIVIDCQDDHGLIELINPVITFREGSEVDTEGCLSVPNIFGEVERAARVKVEFLNRRGKKQHLTATGLLARCIQHECDHLEGIII